MTCEEFEQILLDSRHHVRGGGWLLRVSKVELLREHGNNCPACASRMAETIRLEDALDQLRASIVHMEAPSSVEKKLLHTFRENSAKRHFVMDLVFPWKLVWVSITAAVLVVAVVLLHSKLMPDFVLHEETKKSGSDGVIPSHIVPDSASAPAPAVGQSRNAGNESPRSTLKRYFAEAHTRITGRGKPPGIVPASDVLSLNGGGSVVRVTVPVSSLIAVGVPVGPDLPETWVTADVWMDPFGAVVGIRLVPAKTSAD